MAESKDVIREVLTDCFYDSIENAKNGNYAEAGFDAVMGVVTVLICGPVLLPVWILGRLIALVVPRG